MMITCTQCFSPVYPEQIIDRENDWCEDCYEKWFREEMAYWQPLYEGEKQAGLLDEAKP